QNRERHFARAQDLYGFGKIDYAAIGGGPPTRTVASQALHQVAGVDEDFRNRCGTGTREVVFAAEAADDGDRNGWAARQRWPRVDGEGHAAARHHDRRWPGMRRTTSEADSCGASSSAGASRSFTGP